MKKLFSVISLLLISLILVGVCGCKNQTDNLMDYVSELRCELYEGASQNYTLKASYGFKEIDYQNDGKVGKVQHFLKFTLEQKVIDETTYALCFEHGGKNYEGRFELSHTANALILIINIEDFNEKSFTVSVGTLEQKEEVCLSSIIPQGTMTAEQALATLYKTQKEMIDGFYDSQGNFTAEIYLRVMVKKDKAYWYVGFASGNGKLKAFLLDGVSGDVLAIREVF